MELYVLYTYISTTWGYMNFIKEPVGDYIYPKLVFGDLLTSLCIAATIWIALFVLQGIGLFRMAKKQDLKHKWLVFVPFANIMMMEKLAGKCSVFGQRMRHPGIFALVSQIINFVLCGVCIAAEIYLYKVEGLPSYQESLFSGGVGWQGLEGFSYYVGNAFTILYYVVQITQLVGEIFLFILLLGLYKTYQPRRAYLFAFFSLFGPIMVGVPLRHIFIFIFRNKEAINYEDYQRKQREEFIRRQQQYQQQYNQQYGPRGPYGQYPPYGQQGQYGNPYGQQGQYGNPYGQGQQASYGQQSTSPESNEPFAEFGDGTGTEDGASSAGRKGDDWFA